MICIKHVVHKTWDWFFQVLKLDLSSTLPNYVATPFIMELGSGF